MCIQDNKEFSFLVKVKCWCLFWIIYRRNWRILDFHLNDLKIYVHTYNIVCIWRHLNLKTVLTAIVLIAYSNMKLQNCGQII